MSVALDNASKVYGSQIGESVNAYNPIAQDQLAALRGVASTLPDPGQSALSIVALRVQVQALIRSFNDGFLMVAALFAAGIVLVFFLKKPERASRSRAPTEPRERSSHEHHRTPHRRRPLRRARPVRAPRARRAALARRSGGPQRRARSPHRRPHLAERRPHRRRGREPRRRHELRRAGAPRPARGGLRRGRPGDRRLLPRSRSRGATCGSTRSPIRCSATSSRCRRARRSGPSRRTSPSSTSPSRSPPSRTRRSSTPTSPSPLSDYVLRIPEAHAAASHTARSAELTERAARLEAGLGGQITYYGWVRARLQAFVAHQALDQARAHLSDVKHAFEAGATSKADVLRVEAQVASSELLVQRAEGLARTSEESVRVAMHDPDPSRAYAIGEDVRAPPRAARHPSRRPEALRRGAGPAPGDPRPRRDGVVAQGAGPRRARRRLPRSTRSARSPTTTPTSASSPPRRRSRAAGPSAGRSPGPSTTSASG